jgi:uncharacterized protein with PIN domain
MTTNYVRGTCEITSRTVMTKATFNQKNTFSSKLDLKLKKKLANCYICNTAMYAAEIENFGNKIRNPLRSFEMWCCSRFEKISWTDGARKEGGLHRAEEERNILPTKERKPTGLVTP